jgi:hypothetical protein
MNPSKKGSLKKLGVLGVLSTLVYTLSFPSVVSAARHSQNGLDLVWAFYAPVRWLHDYTPLEKPIETYCDFVGFGPE